MFTLDDRALVANVFSAGIFRVSPTGQRLPWRDGAFLFDGDQVTWFRRPQRIAGTPDQPPHPPDSAPLVLPA